MMAVRRLGEELDPGTLRGEVTLVPVVNEPAFHRGTRTADDGLDLARTCPGRPDGSETERVAHALSELIRSHDHFIDLHTGGTASRRGTRSAASRHRSTGATRASALTGAVSLSAFTPFPTSTRAMGWW